MTLSDYTITNDGVWIPRKVLEAMRDHYSRVADGKRRRIVQEAYAPRIADVVKFYGLNEPDILWYSIKLIP